MLFRSKYNLGDVLLIRTYYNDLIVGYVTDINVFKPENKEYGFGFEYKIRISEADNGFIRLFERSNYTLDGCDNYYEIVGVVGNIETLLKEEDFISEKEAKEC